MWKSDVQDSDVRDFEVRVSYSTPLAPFRFIDQNSILNTYERRILP